MQPGAATWFWPSTFQREGHAAPYQWQVETLEEAKAATSSFNVRSGAA
jgi:hypothetical protein